MDERGQVTVLVVGMTMVVFAVAGLAVDGTRAFLFRRTLQSAADAAALAGASEIERTTYYASRGRSIRLDTERARGAALQSLRIRRLPARFSVMTDEDRVVVILRGTTRTIFLRLVGMGQIKVAVEAVSLPVPER